MFTWYFEKISLLFELSFVKVLNIKLIQRYIQRYYAKNVVHMNKVNQINHQIVSSLYQSAYNISWSYAQRRLFYEKHLEKVFYRCQLLCRLLRLIYIEIGECRKPQKFAPIESAHKICKRLHMCLKILQTFSYRYWLRPIVVCEQSKPMMCANVMHFRSEIANF